jgi:hypothetical protein
MSSWIIKNSIKKKKVLELPTYIDTQTNNITEYYEPEFNITTYDGEPLLNITELLENSNEIDIDFLEIGTSDFDTLLHNARQEEIGISVEPIRHYLDNLPNRKNVLKVNTAITSNKTADTIDIYYIPESVLRENGLPWWLKGCNRINEYHPLHIESNLQRFVKIDKVTLSNVSDFLTQYKIRGIKYLKIDTEGHDAIILNGFFDYLEKEPAKSTVYYPKKILFESNENIPEIEIDRLIERSIRLGYKLVSRGSDTTLILE